MWSINSMVVSDWWSAGPTHTFKCHCSGLRSQGRNVIGARRTARQRDINPAGAALKGRHGGGRSSRRRRLPNRIAAIANWTSTTCSGRALVAVGGVLVRRADRPLSLCWEPGMSARELAIVLLRVVGIYLLIHLSQRVRQRSGRSGISSRRSIRAAALSAAWIGDHRCRGRGVGWDRAARRDDRRHIGDVLPGRADRRHGDRYPAMAGAARARCNAWHRPVRCASVLAGSATPFRRCAAMCGREAWTDAHSPD